MNEINMLKDFYTVRYFIRSINSGKPLWWPDCYTLSRLENDLEVKGYSRGRPLLMHMFYHCTEKEFLDWRTKGAFCSMGLSLEALTDVTVVLPMRQSVNCLYFVSFRERPWRHWVRQRKYAAKRIIYESIPEFFFERVR